MPEAPKEVVPQEKVRVVPPKQPEVPPVTGICHRFLGLRRYNLLTPEDILFQQSHNS